MGGASGGWVKKVKGLRSTSWWLQNSFGDVKSSIGTRVTKEHRHDPLTRTTVWGLLEGMGRAGGGNTGTLLIA